MSPTQTMVAECRTALACYTAGDMAGFDLHRLNARRIADALRPAHERCLLCGMSQAAPYHAAECAAEQSRIAALQEQEIQALRMRGGI